MLGFRLPIGGSQKKILATLPNKLTDEAQRVLNSLASMMDTEKKLFSQILAKSLVDKLSLEEVTMFAGILLEKRYKEEVNGNLAMVFRNSEYFTFQLMLAILNKVGYPFDHSLLMLETAGDAAGIPMTPRQKTPRSARSEDSLSEGTSELTSTSSTSSSSTSLLTQKLNETPPPFEVVISLLPLYLAHLEKNKAELSDKVKEGFIGQFLFSFFLTPLQLESGSFDNNDSEESVIRIAKMGGMLRELQKSKVLTPLTKSLDEVAKSCEKKALGENALAMVVKTYNTILEFYQAKLKQPLHKIATLIEIYRSISQEAVSDVCKEHYAVLAKQLDDKRSDFETIILSFIKQSRTLEMSKIEAKIAVFNEALSKMIKPNFDDFFEGLTPLQRLAVRNPQQQMEQRQLVKQIKFLISLGARLQATTSEYERSAKEVLQDVLGSAAQLAIFTSVRNIAVKPPLNVTQLARRKGLPEVVKLFEEAEDPYVITLGDNITAHKEEEFSDLSIAEIKAIFKKQNPPQLPSPTHGVTSVTQSKSWLPSRSSSSSERGPLAIGTSKNVSASIKSDQEIESDAVDSRLEESDSEPLSVSSSASLKSQSKKGNPLGVERSYNKEDFDLAIPKRTASDNQEQRRALRALGKS